MADRRTSGRGRAGDASHGEAVTGRLYTFALLVALVSGMALTVAIIRHSTAATAADAALVRAQFSSSAYKAAVAQLRDTERRARAEYAQLSSRVDICEADREFVHQLNTTSARVAELQALASQVTTLEAAYVRALALVDEAHNGGGPAR